MNEQRSPENERSRAADGNSVNIALGIDRPYAPHAAAAIASVARHSRGTRLRCLVLHSGVEPPLRDLVEAAAPGAEFTWREIGELDAPAMADREHFSRAILFRLGIETHAPADWRRLIYLDSDIIVAADLRELWDADLEGLPVGAVADCFIDPDAFARRWNLPASGAAYFNSGVLLIDLQRVREERLFSQALEFAAAHIGELRFADQDALNYALWRRWRRLEPRWNVQRHMVIPALNAEIPSERRLRGRPAIIHYTGPEKPWVRDAYHPWSWLYWRSLARTPFFAQVCREQRIGPLRRFVLWQRWLRRRTTV